MHGTQADIKTVSLHCRVSYRSPKRGRKVRTTQSATPSNGWDSATSGIQKVQQKTNFPDLSG